MGPWLILLIVLAYFGVLMGIAFLTSRGANNESFFIGERKSPWYVVAFGMIGASLSGVTFISVPGWVESSGFSYMQVVFGYIVGYFVIALVLLPLYYRLQLTSIYTYLQQRFGEVTYITGASYFLVSRILGASFRLFLVANVLQVFVFDALGVDFIWTVAISILFIWVYTFKGGIKTIIWTDTLQTLFMLIAVGVSIYLICDEMNLGWAELGTALEGSEMTKVGHFESFLAKNHFVKQFLAGMFLAICMTGLDQDMMQKNLSCRSLKDAQTNMFSFSLVLVGVNLLFLTLGALLYMYVDFNPNLALGEEIASDNIYPAVALSGELGLGIGIIFLLGLIAAAYSSADSALTSLTTSVCVDFFKIEKRPKETQSSMRIWVHVGMSVVLLIVIVLFKYWVDRSVIDMLLMVAAYTYGPLLGLFAFGMFTKLRVNDWSVLFITIISVALSVLLGLYSSEWLGGYVFGYELLIVNGGITFTLLTLSSFVIPVGKKGA